MRQDRFNFIIVATLIAISLASKIYAQTPPACSSVPPCIDFCSCNIGCTLVGQGSVSSCDNVQVGSSTNNCFGPFPVTNGTQTNLIIKCNTITVLSCSNNIITNQITTNSCTPFGNSLSAPTHLQTLQIGFSGTQIQLTWDYGSDPIDGFKIESKTPPSGNWVPLTTIADPTARIYADMNVPAFFTASYRISAYQGNVTSAPSNEATAFQLKFSSLNCVGSIGQNCSNPIIWPNLSGQNNRILVDFTPDPTLKLSQVAQDTMFGYNHFNWISTVSDLPPTVQEFVDYQGTQLNTQPFVPFFDPPPGGYAYSHNFPGTNCGSTGPTSDSLPEYYDEQFICDLDDFIFSPQNSPLSNTDLIFSDRPHSSNLGPSGYMQFVTSLVGIPPGNGPPTLLSTFFWSSNNQIFGIGGLSLPNTSGVGTGGIFNVGIVSPKDLPSSVRAKLIQAGVQGIPTTPKIDKDAPMTSAFLSGIQGTNGWFKDPVTVTLIATDIDGPSDIASTSYSLDSGPMTTYTTPFIVSGDGPHTITFGSIDKAGNAESPLQSQIIDIDATPPVISCNANPNTLWPPNGKLNVVTVTGSMADVTSAIDPSGATYVVNDEYGPAFGSPFTIDADGSYSLKLSLIASRNGDDLDGRQYNINVSGKDKAGNSGSCSVVVTVPHDQGH
jgi:hypothetical protein